MDQHAVPLWHHEEISSHIERPSTCLHQLELQIGCMRREGGGREGGNREEVIEGQMNFTYGVLLHEKHMLVLEILTATGQTLFCCIIKKEWREGEREGRRRRRGEGER